MEYIILNNYWKKFYEDKNLTKISKKEKGFLVGVLGCAVLDILVLILLLTEYGSCNLIWWNVLIIVISVALVVGGNRYCEYIKIRERQHTWQNIEQYKAHYSEVSDWLEEFGYSSKRKIRKVLIRCKRLLVEWENEYQENKAYIEKGISLFYIPTLMAIIAWTLARYEKVEALNECAKMAFSLASEGVALYIFLIVSFKFYESLNNTNKKRMSYMIYDIQGVLDYCFGDEEEKFLYLLNSKETDQL